MYDHVINKIFFKYCQNCFTTKRSKLNRTLFIPVSHSLWPTEADHFNQVSRCRTLPHTRSFMCSFLDIPAICEVCLSALETRTTPKHHTSLYLLLQMTDEMRETGVFLEWKRETWVLREKPVTSFVHHKFHPDLTVHRTRASWMEGQRASTVATDTASVILVALQ